MLFIEGYNGGLQCRTQAEAYVCCLCVQQEMCLCSCNCHCPHTVSCTLLKNKSPRGQCRVNGFWKPWKWQRWRRWHCTSLTYVVSRQKVLQLLTFFLLVLWPSRWSYWLHCPSRFLVVLLHFVGLFTFSERCAQIHTNWTQSMDSRPRPLMYAKLMLSINTNLLSVTQYFVRFCS